VLIIDREMNFHETSYLRNALTSLTQREVTHAQGQPGSKKKSKSAT
jgi:hypothetical protein